MLQRQQHRSLKQRRQLSEQKRYCQIVGVPVIEDGYQPEEFYLKVKGLEKEKEGGARCAVCFKLRLAQTAHKAKELGFDLFGTTLTVSPHKNAQVLNAIGKELSAEYDIAYLYSDFKKKNGYKRSCELSEQYHMYRQDYCGCIYSKMEAEARKQI